MTEEDFDRVWTWFWDGKQQQDVRRKLEKAWILLAFDYTVEIKESDPQLDTDDCVFLAIQKLLDNESVRRDLAR